MPRYFHLYADNKTVKEIDGDTWRRYAKANVYGYNKKRLCMLLKGEVFFTKGQGVTVPLKQLKTILEKETT